MIIQCDQCDRKFRVDDTKIKPPGSRVRCSKCGNVFFVEKNDNAKASEEKSPPSPAPPSPPSQDSLQIDSDFKGDEQKSGLEQDAKESPKDDISIDINPPAESEQKETVWSIDESEGDAGTGLGIDEPSSEIGIEQPAQNEATAPEPEIENTPASQPQPDSAMSWAAIQTEDKDQPATNETSSEPAPPVQPEDTPAENQNIPPEPAPLEIQDAASQATGQEDLTDPSGQVSQPPPEPTLDLDLDKANQVDQQQSFQSAEPSDDIFSSDLSVDQQKMSQLQAESHSGTTAKDLDSNYEAPSTRASFKPQRKSTGSKIGSFFVKIIVGLCILVIIASVGLIAAINLEILSKEKTKELRSFLVANLPITIKDPLEGIEITQTNGQWINSSNGPLFIVKGNITNFTENIVNYIQLKTEFINNGQIVNESDIYAGNTFTYKELQTLPLTKIAERLNRKNGDIDFSDPRKLAGTNYNLMPGDSIQFYSVFPSKSQILGLKHSIEIIDAEIILIEKSE